MWLRGELAVLAQPLCSAKEEAAKGIPKPRNVRIGNKIVGLGGLTVCALLERMGELSVPAAFGIGGVLSAVATKGILIDPIVDYIDLGQGTMARGTICPVHEPYLLAYLQRTEKGE